VGKREDNKRHKREALLSAATTAFREEGYERASIERFVRDAGVARGTFYLYFPDKRAVFEAVMDRFAEPVLAVLDGMTSRAAAARDRADLLDAYRSMALQLALVYATFPAEVEIAFREARVPGEAGDAIRRREEAMFTRIHAFTRTAVERGLLDSSAPELLGFVVFGAVERLFYEARRGTPLGDPMVVANEVLGLFGRALGLPVT
jgi:AcrR family transcriptional regulator